MSTIAYSSQELVNQYNRLSSGHFFDADAMQFFKRRVTENYVRLNDTEALFVTTEKGPSEIRRATIRRAKLVSYIRESDGQECEKITLETVDFNQLTLVQAKRELKLLTESLQTF